MAFRVSVVIPVYNGSRYIAQAVESVRMQTVPPREIIVVDDGSTDDTRDVVRNLKGVHYVSQPNRGPAAARNNGVRSAIGEFLAFLDADDRWTPAKTELQLSLLREHREVDVVIGYSQREVISPLDGGAPVHTAIGDPLFYLSLGAGLFRRAAFDRVGDFDESLALGEDTDWYLRAREGGLPIRFHSEVVQYCLRHDRNVTRDRDVANRYMVHAYKRSLDRRRAAATAAIQDWSEEMQWLPKGSA